MRNRPKWNSLGRMAAVVLAVAVSVGPRTGTALEGEGSAIRLNVPLLILGILDGQYERAVGERSS